MNRGVSSASHSLSNSPPRPKPPGALEREMPLDVVDRIVGVRMRVVVLRQQHRGAEKDRMPPPFRQDLALDLDALDERGVGRQPEPAESTLSATSLIGAGRRRIDRDLRRLAVEIAGRALPVLSFPLIHVHPHRVAVRARKARVDVHERLHPVLAGRNVAQARERMAAIGGADHRPRRQAAAARRTSRRAERPSGPVCSIGVR